MTRLTLGPILFHWPAQQKIDFYAKIADEAPIDTVYLGEVICSKRAPFFEQHYAKVTERRERGGKKVVFASLAEVMLKRERKMTEGLCDMQDHEIEVNDTSALWHLSGRPHRIGPYMNVYNEETMAYLAGRGATHFSLPIELPGKAVEVLCQHAARLGLSIEVQVFGRASLALSARCYHARAHSRIKDNCQFVCEQDPDGMPLKTLSGQDFLAVNGIQTLSHTYLNLLAELDQLTDVGVSDFRLVPHTQDMVGVAQIFRAALDRELSAEDAENKLGAKQFPAPFSNGFWHGQPGHVRVGRSHDSPSI
jgi:O2-independent ubiquinone biosynthesis protein UbiV